MKEKVLQLWEGNQSEVHAVDTRQKLSDNGMMSRAVHLYARAQCRTTHKRQDC